MSLFSVRKWAISGVCACLLLEILGWIERPERLPDFTVGSEETYAYQFDPDLGWFPEPHQNRYMQAARRIHIQNNSLGFRDEEWGLKVKPRLLFLGDSFVWGSDVDAQERFPDLLSKRVPSHQILNMSVAGYGTDQELLLLRKYIDSADPDVVFLLFVGLNDIENITSNFSYGSYKPYFEAKDGALVERGVPVPKSLAYTLRDFTFPFRWSYVARGMAGIAIQSQSGKKSIPDLSVEILEEMRREVLERGRTFMLGYESISAALLDRLKSRGFEPFDLLTVQRFEGFGSHWTPEGHQWVADHVCDALREKGIECRSSKNVDRSR